MSNIEKITTAITPLERDKKINEIIDDKVSKSGDTMTGTLNINYTDEENQVTKFITVKNTAIEKAVIPEKSIYSDILFTDKDDNDLGALYYRHTPTNRAMCMQITGLDGRNSRIVMGQDPTTGEFVFAFPHSVCVDGQWVFSNVTICSSRNAETSDKDWDLSAYLPDDNYNYEVLIVGISVTGATSGNINRVYLKSSIITSNTTLAGCVTRTSASNSVYGMSTFPIGADKILTVGGYTNNTGTYNLYLRGYRRIGTNS